jgi:hypothetical protein
MAEHNYGKRFVFIVRKLRAAFPLSKPLRFVFKSLHTRKLCGCCLTYLDADGQITKFVIEIDSNLAYLSAVDTLLHEYAHALDQDRNGVATKSHRISWGEMYALIFQVYEQLE